MVGADASSSASKRAFSALRASSALRFSSLSSLAFEALAGASDHLEASRRSCGCGGLSWVIRRDGERDGGSWKIGGEVERRRGEWNREVMSAQD